MFLFCHFCQHTKGSGCIWVTFFSLAVGSSLTLDFLWFSVKGWTPKSWGSSLFPKMGTTNWWTWLVLLNLLPLPTWNMMIWVCCAILKKQLQTTYTDTYATNLGLFSSFFRGLIFYWKTYIYIYMGVPGRHSAEAGAMQLVDSEEPCFYKHLMPDFVQKHWMWGKVSLEKMHLPTTSTWLQYLISMTNLSCKPAP